MPQGKKRGAADHDDSGLAALMRSEYNLSALETDEMTDAEFYGLAQNLERLEERRAYHIAKMMAPMLGIKLKGL